MTYRTGEANHQRRGPKEGGEFSRGIEARTFPTDCEECGKDCYCSLGCKVKGCPYRGRQ